MRNRNAIVLSVDRLGAGFLGPYGNTWIETPHWNRLAAESALFEFAISDSPRLPAVYRSYWQGSHAAGSRTAAPALAEILQPTDVHAALLTDDPAIAKLATAAAFDECLVIRGGTAGKSAATIEDTQMARLLATVTQWLATAPEPFLLWIHARGMAGAWDAPQAFREQFADEDDPLPPPFTAPPTITLASGHDPDDVLGIVQAYAGQIVALDLCLGAALDAIDELHGASETLLLATSPRGYPLGEHGLVGGENLHEETLHVPLLVRCPPRDIAALRHPALVQPPDVLATLLDWFDFGDAAAGVWGQSLLRLANDEPQFGRDRACAVADQQQVMRTPAWHLYLLADAGARLYFKPDDRWEVNELSQRCREIVVTMQSVLADYLRAVDGGGPRELAPLADALVEGIE